MFSLHLNATVPFLSVSNVFIFVSPHGKFARIVTVVTAALWKIKSRYFCFKSLGRKCRRKSLSLLNSFVFAKSFGLHANLQFRTFKSISILRSNLYFKCIVKPLNSFLWIFAEKLENQLGIKMYKLYNFFRPLSQNNTSPNAKKITVVLMCKTYLNRCLRAEPR